MLTTAATREVAVLGSIGRKRLCFALTGADGALRPETIRSYDAESTSGVSGALGVFQRDLALAELPPRAGIAVAGLARGDAISITRTRWFLSRSGLQAMLGAPPLILNDFAAEAWAMHGMDARVQEPFGGIGELRVTRPGCYVVLGITSGLGAAVVTRGDAGQVAVLPTEAGHGAFAAGTEELARLAADLYPGRHPVAAEDVVSAPGLLAIYQLLARRAGAPARAQRPEDVTRAIATDPLARAACELLCKAFWSQAGSLVMTYGAWDGVLVTGAVAGALRPLLRRPDCQSSFVGTGKHGRVLQVMPRGFVAVEHGDLLGVAEALRHNLPVD